LPVLTTSWDDGHPLDQRVAGLLAKYGLTGTFYVPFQNSRAVMGAAAIRDLSQAFEVGAHTVHHTVLTEVPKATADSEIRESKKRMDDLTGRSCEAFCFPKGRFHRCHIEMLRQAGFRSARTVELLSTAPPRPTAGVHLIPTTMQVTAHSRLPYLRNCAKRLAFRNLVRYVSYARSGSWVEAVESLLDVVAESGGVFHLWGHSWEIEENRQWSQLESALCRMGEMRKRFTCVPNSKICRSVNAKPQAPGSTTADQRPVF